MARDETHECTRDKDFDQLHQRLDRIESRQEEILKRIGDGDVRFAKMEQTLSGYNLVVAAVGVAVIGGIITFIGTVGTWVIGAMNAKGG